MHRALAPAALAMTLLGLLACDRANRISADVVEAGDASPAAQAASAPAASIYSVVPPNARL